VSHGAKKILTATCGLLLAASSVALAARTDVIVLTNGDRVTGEVVHMRKGKLQVKTDDMGSLSIEWDKVAALTTAERYDVTMRDGLRLLGRISPGPPGTLGVVADDESVTTMRMAEVASLDAIKTTFWQRIDGSIDLGGSYTQSSGVAQLSLEAQTTYRRPSFAYATSLSMNLTRQPDAPETSRYSLNLDYTRFRSNGWLFSTLGLFEGNEELGFTFRGTGAISVGRYLLRSGHVEFLTAGGLAVGREVPVEEPSATNVDGLIAVDASVFAYDYPTRSISLRMLVFPSFDDLGRVRVNANGRYKRELFRDFYFALSAYNAFDNRPKAETAGQNDFGGSVSFGWTF
jgi:hypothetical protein